MDGSYKTCEECGRYYTIEFYMCPFCEARQLRKEMELFLPGDLEEDDESFN